MQITGTHALERAIEILGSQGKLADVVGVTQQGVSYVLRARKPVPAEWCPKIEAATSGEIPRHQLRPDLFNSEAA